MKDLKALIFICSNNNGELSDEIVEKVFGGGAKKWIGNNWHRLAGVACGVVATGAVVYVSKTAHDALIDISNTMHNADRSLDALNHTMKGADAAIGNFNETLNAANESLGRANRLMENTNNLVESVSRNYSGGNTWLLRQLGGGS